MFNSAGPTAVRPWRQNKRYADTMLLYTGIRVSTDFVLSPLYSRHQYFTATTEESFEKARNAKTNLAGQDLADKYSACH